MAPQLIESICHLPACQMTEKLDQQFVYSKNISHIVITNTLDTLDVMNDTDLIEFVETRETLSPAPLRLHTA
ncbi:hypothetical protein JCM3770_005420 [Rhodotorula araucariae]